MKKPLVSIIIVNYNGGEVFKNCLKSLSKIKYSSWELVVVDNGSTDSSLKPIKPNIQYTKYKILVNKVNVGFAPANNQALPYCKGKYILLLNNDTKVTPSFLTKLVQKLESNSNIAVVQPKIFLINKKTHLDNVGSFLTRTGFLTHWGYMKKDSKEFQKETEIFSAKGACMLIRKKVIDKVGLFDNSFKSYFEETDFCWRVWLAGYKILFLPQSKIYHHVGFTSSKMPQADVNYHSLKNRISSLLKNLALPNLVFILLPHLFIVCSLGTYWLIRMQFKKSLMVFKAILYSIFHLPQNIIKRRKVQHLRSVNDKELFKIIMHPFPFAQMFSHFQKVEANLNE